MLVSDIHGLEGPSFQRAGMVVSAEATLHLLEEEDVVSLSLSLYVARGIMSHHTVGM